MNNKIDNKSKHSIRRFINTQRKQIMTDPILRKGHAHGIHEYEPQVCPDCRGMSTYNNVICPTCDGEGEI